MLDGDPVVINGDGLQTRDYVYVDDVVRANLAVVEHPGFSIYNVGTGVETDVNTLFDSIAEAAEYDRAPEHGPGMPGEQRRSCISSDRLLEELSVAVQTPLASGIPSTVQWFMHQ
jgi:UDP-glucose 4-epimerase